MNLAILKSLADKISPVNLYTKYGKLPKYVVTVIGCSGSMGSGISTLLANNSSIRQLRLYDFIDSTAFISKIKESHPKSNIINYYPSQFNEALDGSDIILLPIGIPRSVDRKRNNLFQANARIVGRAIHQISTVAPDAFILVMSNPITSILPSCVEILKRSRVYNPNRIIGVTSSDGMRSGIYLSNLLNENLNQINVPCIGGGHNENILPLYSQTHIINYPNKRHSKLNISNISNDQRNELIRKIQKDDDSEIIQDHAMDFPGTVIDALANTLFVNNFIRSLEGEQGIVLNSYIQSGLGHCEYLNVPYEMKRDGNIKQLPLGSMDDYETDMFNRILPDMKNHINKGIEFGRLFNPNEGF